MSKDASPHSDALPESARCPHCGTYETEQFSAFGSALSLSQYYCRRCRTVFEFFKWRGAAGRDGEEARPGDGERTGGDEETPGSGGTDPADSGRPDRGTA